MRNNTDWIAYKFLKIMEVEVNPFPSFSQNSAWNPNFPAWVANEITEKTFTSSEQEKISSLIEELKKEDPSLIERAYTETKKRISGLGIITGKVFKQLSTVAWKFFGLIEVEKEHFSEVYRFFSQMLSDLGIQGGKRYQKSEVKEYFFKALKKLEELVKSKKKIKTGEKTSNSSNSEPNKTEQTEGEKNSSNHQAPSKNQGEKESNSPPSEKINPEKLPSSSKSELLELIRKGEKEDDPVKLGKIIEQIEEFRGEKTYESLEPKISALKKKLANQNFKEYLNTNREMIEKELKIEGVKENELELEIQKKLENLRKGEIDQAEVETIKNKVSDSIKLKGVEKKLEKLLKDYQNAPHQKKKELSKQIIAFINSDNYFHQKVYQQRKSEIDSLLKNSDSSLYSSSDYYPQIIAGGIAVVGTTFVLIRFFKNRRIAAK